MPILNKAGNFTQFLGDLGKQMIEFYSLSVIIVSPFCGKQKWADFNFHARKCRNLMYDLPTPFEKLSFVLVAPMLWANILSYKKVDIQYNQMY